MASLVSGIYDLSQGDPAKGQENQLSSLGGFETGTGEGLTTAGANFDESILSGDPTKVATALAPEISSQQQQVQQQKNQDAQFAPRSGGTAASDANASTAGRSNIINLEGGLESGAASGALSAGGNLLSQASGNINDVAGLKTARQAAQTADVGGIAQGAAEIATGFDGGADAGSLGDMAGGTPEETQQFGELMQSGTIADQGAGGGNAGLDLSSFQ
jgi:hypothetical protein